MKNQIIITVYYRIIQNKILKKYIVKKYCEKTDNYSRLLHNFSEQEIKKIYAQPFTLPIDPEIKVFKYMLLHNRIYNNFLLFKMKIVETDKCPYCNQVQHTDHMFFYCKEVQSLLSTV